MDFIDSCGQQFSTGGDSGDGAAYVGEALACGSGLFSSPSA